MKNLIIMKKTNKFLISTLVGASLLFGCGENLLDVPNENTPDITKVLASPQDVETVAAGMYNTIFYGEQGVDGVKPMLTVGADNATCSWGNFDMRWFSNEPRDLAWNNTPNYGTQGHNKYSYDQFYSAIGSATDVLTAINGGMEIIIDGVDQTQRAQAFAKFGFGLAYGNLALIYDRAHIVDENTTVEGTLDTASPYQDVAAAAVAYLEEALALTEDSFTIPASWLGTASPTSGADFKKIINTSIARLLAYMPRNNADLLDVDWAKVKTHADAGITSDWNIEQDNNIWWFGGDYYLTTAGWARVDMYVANLMEPSLPQHWTNDAAFPHPAQPVDPMDARLESDFQYMPSNDFLAARGYYHFSCYRFKRYDDVIINGVGGLGPKPTMLAVENDMPI
jgi:hypothetical protein